MRARYNLLLMNFSALLSLADGWKTLTQAEDALGQGLCAVQLEGMPVAARGWLLARLQGDLKKPLVIVTYTDETAQRLADDIRLFLPEAQTVERLPSSLNLLLDDADSERDVRGSGKRVRLLGDLAQGVLPDVLVTTTAALLQLAPPPSVLKSRRLNLAVGQTLSLDQTAARLNAFGYRRVDLVQLPGTFARRGDLLDVWPADAEGPVRIDLFGDEIESLRPFDPESQRSEGTWESAVIVAAHEMAFTRERMATAQEVLKKQLSGALKALSPERAEKLRDSAEGDIVKLGLANYFGGVERYLPLLHPDATPTASFLPEDVILVLDEPAQLEPYAERELEAITKSLAARAERGEVLPPPAPNAGGAFWESFEPTFRQLTQTRPTLLLTLLARALPFLAPSQHLTVQGAPAESFGGRPTAIKDAIATWTSNDVRVVIVSAQAPRIRGFGVLETEKTKLLDGLLTAGFRIPEAKLVVLSDAELFGERHRFKKQTKRREFREGMRITSLLDVKAGDYVVHIHHGVGMYAGLTKMNTAPFPGAPPVEKEFLVIAYEGSDRLYVPVDQVDRVQKYIGSEGGAPSVNKLGGTEWLKATAKAKRHVKEIAGELIALYAARQAMNGYAYAPDSPWIQDMELAFPYTETPDQLAAIEDVKRDLESPRPMDRLICGDVGFGKTEVAMRAAFKVASEGRQVAVLCPTTVLASQHFQTFSERLAAFPVRVDQLSRFRSPREQSKTLEDLRVGGVDIVVGTHRILSKDIEFKDLGLVIVDEEQRFGVTHKERLKQLRKSVDVLAMSATPIPRTLHMSLSGIRDMSLINDPPEGRSAVKTFVKEFDDLIIREALLRELDRGGQAYFLHNRVESIYHVANHIEQLVPNARCKVAHGQMSDDELEDTMFEFYHKKFDVLVCTTIVESGLDIPNVNTIFIDNADKLGLSQLYQLRGRVGRSKVQAFAYLLYRRGKALTTIAEQRLDAVREFTDLGSGYKIALRDLELRGAGNLLGAEQSGTVSSVGFDLYLQLLEQAIHELKGEELDKEDIPLPTVDLPVAATIPQTYIPAEPQRILMYKKLAAVRDRADVSRLQDEFEDRFGDPPPPVWNALGLLRLRLRCVEVGIENIQTEARQVIITFKSGVFLPKHALRALTAAYKPQGGYEFQAGKVVMNIQSSKVLTQTEELVELLDKAIKEPPPPPDPREEERRRDIRATLRGR